MRDGRMALPVVEVHGRMLRSRPRAHDAPFRIASQIRGRILWNSYTFYVLRASEERQYILHARCVQQDAHFDLFERNGRCARKIQGH